jgi:multidrug efflux pump subunit AcrB
METQVTKLIEESVNTISGLEELRSATTEGSSRITAVFALERDSDAAAQDVRDKISLILAKFPTDTDPPIIEKFDPDSAPVLGIVVSARREPREITEFVDKRIKQPLETISGVSITWWGPRGNQVVLDRSWRRTASGSTRSGRRLPTRTWRCRAAASRLVKAKKSSGPWAGSAPPRTSTM